MTEKKLSLSLEFPEDSMDMAVLKYEEKSTDKRLQYMTSGNIGLIKKALKMGASIDMILDEGFMTPLIWATERRQPKVVRFLLENGANRYALKSSSALAKVPVEIAVSKGFGEIVDIFLEQEEDINRQYNWNETLLTIASEKGFEDIVKKLLDKNARVDIPNTLGENALSKAAQNGHLNVIKILVEAQPDSVNKMARNLTPIMVAAQNNKAEAVKLLAQLGGNIDAQNDFGETAVMLALRSNKISAVTALLELGADVCLKDNQNNTAMHYMARCCKPSNGWLTENPQNSIEAEMKIEIMKKLVSSQADINAFNNEGKTPLTLALEDENDALALAMLHMGATAQCATPFHMFQNNKESSSNFYTSVALQQMKNRANRNTPPLNEPKRVAVQQVKTGQQQIQKQKEHTYC